MNFLENELVIKVTDQYLQLSGKDKLLTQFLSVFIILCIGYFLIYQPSVNAKNNAKQQLQQTRTIYHEIQKIVPKILQARINAGNAAKSSQSTVNNKNKSMTAMVNDSSKKFAIIINKSSADGNDGISISGNEQVFDQLIRFVGDLNTSYGLNIDTYSIKETQIAGKVDFNIKVTR